MRKTVMIWQFILLDMVKGTQWKCWVYLSRIYGKEWRTWKKKYLISNDYILDKVLDKIKMVIGIEKFDEAKILIETDDKFLDEVTLKTVVVLISCVIKDDGKFYVQKRSISKIK